MRLTFENNNFVLYNPVSSAKGVLTCWLKNHANNSYRTTKMKEAARFRKYADNKAKTILNKLRLKTYPFPQAGGPISPEGLTLYPFQKDQGVPHILGGNRRYIAHQPGLGKSPQAICAVNLKPGRALIICPSFLKINWAREISKWSTLEFPHISIVPESTKRHFMNWEVDFVICSDTMLAKDWVQENLLKTQFRFVFVDEAHRFKTPEASRTVALFGGAIKKKDKETGQITTKFQSPGLVYKAEHVCLLSGTPMLNRPSELWPMLYALAPELIDFMPYAKFVQTYCNIFVDDKGVSKISGSKNEADLNSRIMGSFMQRIKKEDVLKDLPDKQREVVLVDVELRSKELIALDKMLQNEIMDAAIKAAEALPHLKIAKIGELGELAKYRHDVGKLKAEWVSNFVKGFLLADEDESIILFAHHRDVVQELTERLFEFSPVVINGGVSGDDRILIEDNFQKRKCRLIIGNIDSMNLGLTLTAATRVVFAEYSWTPAQNEQAEDRAHRIGQKSSVFAQYIVLPESIDQKILDTLLKKERSIERIIDANN